MAVLKRALDYAQVVFSRRARYRRVFAGRDGEWVLRDLLHRFGVHENPFYPGDSTTTLHNLGRQSAGAEILHVLNLSDEKIAQLRESENGNPEDDDAED